MKTLEISISREAVMAAVAEAALFTGHRLPASENDPAEIRVERVRTAANDSLLLARYWEEAASILAIRLKDHLLKSDFGGESLEIILSLSNSYDDTQTPSLRASLFSFMENAIIARWFRVTLPSESLLYSAEADRLLTEAERRLCHRLPPQRRKLKVEN